ncbi:hypothetical protein L873DRAFT_1806159 [Choiromyces venosus 120613-1]|uniref:BZIP domain-containing protein n=1 Tax=Choiromyces venosus 120613-1 TaxID=1336337 RepID=A0A3N4JU30_9PEZI|nr:hypothetical protein L873DRAFT_1806159 [Choiromyces venosus 120613-1]
MAAAVKTSPPHSSASSASSASSPEPTTMAQQAQFPTPRRKGGRKPVYATQEERKMRNRAAQAAFRERRTEYIKHLEATIKHQEESLSSLQQSSRNAADEVLMLRYKNSLLERILLEKGINVAAELKAFAQYDDRPQPTAPQPIPRPMPSQGQPLQQQQQSSLQQQHMHRPMMAQPQQQQKRPSINPSPDSLFIKTSPIMPPSSRNNSPSIAIPTPPDASAYQIPQSVVTTPTAPSEFHPGIPMQNFYPSPYQAHMEELGKLPRVLPIYLLL